MAGATRCPARSKLPPRHLPGALRDQQRGRTGAFRRHSLPSGHVYRPQRRRALHDPRPPGPVRYQRRVRYSGIGSRLHSGAGERRPLQKSGDGMRSGSFAIEQAARRPPSRISVLGGWPDEAAWERFGLRSRRQRAANALDCAEPVDARQGDIRVRGNTTSILEKDSCVTMYWDERPLKPAEKRTVGFSYGLGSVANQESGGKLLLTVGGRMAVDAEFTLTALISNPDPQGESLTFAVPTGLELIGGHEKESVPILEANATRKVSTVTWKIRAKRAGEYSLVVKSSKGVQQSYHDPDRNRTGSLIERRGARNEKSISGGQERDDPCPSSLPAPAGSRIRSRNSSPDSACSARNASAS